MTREASAGARAPFTIPCRDGPIALALDRVLAAGVVIVAAGFAVALSCVSPLAQGYDTHVQFGMAACGWPATLGIPCPTCGCTTAACHVVHGNLGQALATQPFGACLAVAGLLLGLHALFCLLRGRSFADLLVRLPFWRIIGGAVLFMLLAWYYKYLVFQP